MRLHTPPGLLKSGMPLSVDMPAPVKTTIRSDVDSRLDSSADPLMIKMPTGFIATSLHAAQLYCWTPAAGDNMDVRRRPEQTKTIRANRC